MNEMYRQASAGWGRVDRPACWKQREAAALVLVGLLIGLAGCQLPGISSTPTPTATATSQPTPTAVLYHGCPVTPVQHVPYVGQASLAGVPWIQAVPASAGVTGHLFYAATIPVPASQSFIPLYTNGKAPGDATTKILWIVANDHVGDELRITGIELSPEPGSFQQTFPWATTARNIPSIVVVPSPGCWQLTLIDGAVMASATFWVIAA